MKKRITFTNEQYETIETDDGLDVLKALGIDYRDVAEPLENLQQRIAEAYRDQHNTVTFEIK